MRWLQTETTYSRTLKNRHQGVGLSMTAIVPIESIVSKIVLLRGEKVLLDRDLAELYGVSTKALKQAVRRNPDRFPSDFMFELTKEEFANLRSQIVTSKRNPYYINIDVDSQWNLQ